MDGLYDALCDAVEYGDKETAHYFVLEIAEHTRTETPAETNADKIRSMSDEELAKFLKEHFSNGICVGEDIVLDWLREVEEW